MQVEADSRSEGWLGRARSFARRPVVRLLMLLAMLALVVRLMTARPSSVEVSYRLGEAASGLLEADLRYLRDEEDARRAHFSFRARPASEAFLHAVDLYDGEYRAELLLTFRTQALPKALWRYPASVRDGETSVRLSRPLIVQGSGQVRVYVVSEDEPSSDEKPSDEKPSDEKPSDEKPSDEKPSDQKPSDGNQPPGP